MMGPQVDLPTLSGAVTAVGGLVVTLVKLVEKLQANAVKRANEEAVEEHNRLLRAQTVCRREIAEAFSLRDSSAAERLSRVLGALTEAE